MNPAKHYAEAEKYLAFADELQGDRRSRSEGRSYEIAVLRAQVHATLATVDRAVSRQAEVDAQRAMCTCAHLPDIPAAVTHVDPDCPIHGGS